MPQKEIIEIIKKFVYLLKDDGIEIKKAILYGSHARGNARSDSDIDILLVSDTFDTDDDNIKARPWIVAARFDYQIEPYIVTEKKFRMDDVSPIFDIIRKEGIEIEF